LVILSIQSKDKMNQSNITGDDGMMEQGLTMPIIFQTILFAVVCLVGLVGNTLVIYVVIRFSKMQTVTNMYIVNLAIADECFLIGIPFLLVTMINKQWIFGNAACKAYMISTSINQFTSSIFLCIMSADRYIAVCHPISSPKWRTPLISRIVSLLAWTCSIVLMTPIIEHATELEPRPGQKSCIIDWNNNENITDNSTSATGATIFTTYTFVFSFAIPLVLILVFYCLVIQKLKTVGPKNKSKEKKRSHRKVTNLVLTVVTVYVICWLPYWITQIAMLSTTSLSNQ
jgi:heme/copper-type cytochrome/quinol oxidase subunit 2